MVPRIIKPQSQGVDVIVGVAFTSIGIKQAVADAIDAAGGKSAEWQDPPPRSALTVRLAGYDVIVVGLVGAGMPAYLKAPEPVTVSDSDYYLAVYGIELSGKIGGNSATAGGLLATNSTFIKNLYGISDYVDEETLLKQWYADMEADVPGNEISANTNFVAPFGMVQSQTFPLPDVTKKTAEYEGGPKWEIIKNLYNQSGETVDWLGGNYCG
jgi:hypothetical protein